MRAHSQARQAWFCRTLADLSPIPFLIRRRGALHAIDYENWQRKSLFYPVPSLGEICSEILAEDSSFLKLFLSYLPTQLHSKLMGTAILNGLDRSMEALMSAWPGQVLCLRALCSHFFNTVDVIYDHKLHKYRMHQGIHITDSLLRAFLELIQSKSETSQLRVLDLREFPTVDIIVNPLALKIVQMNFELYDEKQKDEANHSQYEIYIDCSVHNENTFQQLWKALKLCQDSNPAVCLHVSKIDASCLGEIELYMLLETLNANDLTGLCMQYNYVSDSGLLRLIPQIGRLRSLTALDVSCNDFNFILVPEICAKFADVLASLPHLRRLDLSNNEWTNHVQQVLGLLSNSKLDYLNLSASVLSVSDVNFLAHAPFVSSLLELDLSENIVLSRHLPQLLAVLESVTSSLQILEIEDCKFGNNQLETLVRCFLQMKRLRYLNFSRQPLTSIAVCVHIPQLAILPNLECVRISYTEDCYSNNLDDLMYDQRKSSFRNQMERAAASYRQNSTNVEQELKFVWTECCMSLL